MTTKKIEFFWEISVNLKKVAKILENFTKLSKPQI
jgi:hypothetical protein